MGKTNKITMFQILNDPNYRGKHVILVAGKVFTAKTGTEANKVIDKLEKKYPREIPAVTYIPNTDTLILWL